MPVRPPPPCLARLEDAPARMLPAGAGIVRGPSRSTRIGRIEGWRKRRLHGEPARRVNCKAARATVPDRVQALELCPGPAAFQASERRKGDRGCASCWADRELGECGADVEEHPARRIGGSVRSQDRTLRSLLRKGCPPTARGDDGRRDGCRKFPLPAFHPPVQIPAWCMTAAFEENERVDAAND